jgi:hypothetical protein
VIEDFRVALLFCLELFQIPAAFLFERFSPGVLEQAFFSSEAPLLQSEIIIYAILKRATT